MKELIEKFLSNKGLVRYKIVWNSGIKPEAVLAICKTKEECESIISKRRKMWKESAGFDITSQLEIVKFYLEDKE